MSTFKDVGDLRRGDEIARKLTLLESQIAVACARLAETDEGSIGGGVDMGRLIETLKCEWGRQVCFIVWLEIVKIHSPRLFGRLAVGCVDDFLVEFDGVEHSRALGRAVRRLSENAIYYTRGYYYYCCSSDDLTGLCSSSYKRLLAHILVSGEDSP